MVASPIYPTNIGFKHSSNKPINISNKLRSFEVLSEGIGGDNLYQQSTIRDTQIPNRCLNENLEVKAVHTASLTLSRGHKHRSVIDVDDMGAF